MYICSQRLLEALGSQELGQLSLKDHMEEKPQQGLWDKWFGAPMKTAMSILVFGPDHSWVAVKGLLLTYHNRDIQ